MLPPIEFSIGRTPWLAAARLTDANTSSKLRHGRSSTAPPNRIAAASLNAPGSP